MLDLRMNPKGPRIPAVLAPLFAAFLALCGLLPQGAPARAAVAPTSPAEWVGSGEDHLAAGRATEALYCFYMASFKSPGEPRIADLIEKTKELVRRREKGPYVVPREPQNFHYILFRTQTESTMEDTGEGGEVYVKMGDGSRVNVANYINRLRDRRKGGLDEGDTGDRLVVRRGRTSEKLIALTFDDGPNPSITPRLLDALARNDVKATFFVVGRNARAYPNLIRRIEREGHLLANHSDNHPNMARMGEPRIRRELDAVDEALAGAGQPAPAFFRPPYGAMGSALKEVCRETGRTIVLWSIDTNDWRKPAASKMLRHILNNARPGDVVLMHDIHPQCVEIIDPLAEAMREAGYRFVLLDELFGAGARPALAARPAKEPPAAEPVEIASAAPAPPAPAASPAPRTARGADVLRFMKRLTGSFGDRNAAARDRGNADAR